MSRFIYRRRQGVSPARPVEVPAHQVLTGDCRAVMAPWPGAMVDLIVTDPPYLVNYRDRSGRTIANDRDSAWLRPAFAEAYRVLKPNRLCVSFYGWQAIEEFMGAWKAAGFRPVGHLVFTKRYASSVRFTAARHEAAYILAKGSPALPAQALTDVIPFPYTGNRLHPTQKPVAAMAAIIEAYSQPGELVLDPFCGSGTTLVAAQSVQRRAIGIELNAGYATAAQGRLSGP